MTIRDRQRNLRVLDRLKMIMISTGRHSGVVASSGVVICYNKPGHSPKFCAKQQNCLYSQLLQTPRIVTQASTANVGEPLANVGIH